MNEDILKEFKIRFSLDTKQLNKEVQKTENNLTTFAKYLNSLIVGYVGYKGIASITNNFAKFNVEIENNTRLLGYNTINITNMGNALKRFGGDTNSVLNSLNSLSSALQQAKFGSGALLEANKQYGISFQNSNGTLMNAEQLLKSLTSQLLKFDKQTRVAIASQLGLDNSLVLAFEDGGKELSNLINKQKELGLVTKNDFKISRDFNNALLDFKDTFQSLINIIGRFVLPFFTKILKTFTAFVEYIKRNKYLVISFFTAMALALSPLILSLGKLAKSSLLAFAPFAKAGLIIAGLALVIEDIYFYFKGWDSVTGQLVKKLPALGVALEYIRPLVQSIFDTFDNIVNFLKDPSWDNFLNIFVKIGDAVINTIKKPIEQIYNYLSDLMSKITSWITDNNIFKAIFGNISTQSIPMISNNNSNSNNFKVTNNINQNISTNNPKQIANNINSEFINSINAQRQIIGNN